jgi:hypothetical protein
MSKNRSSIFHINRKNGGKGHKNGKSAVFSIKSPTTFQPQIFLQPNFRFFSRRKPFCDPRKSAENLPYISLSRISVLKNSAQGRISGMRTFDHWTVDHRAIGHRTIIHRMIDNYFIAKHEKLLLILSILSACT